MHVFPVISKILIEFQVNNKMRFMKDNSVTSYCLVVSPSNQREAVIIHNAEDVRLNILSPVDLPKHCLINRSFQIDALCFVRQR